jgi:hypothetical protein
MRQSVSIRRWGFPLLILCLMACSEAEAPVAKLAGVSLPKQLPFPNAFEAALELEPIQELPPGAGVPILFIHLLDREGQVVRTFDRPLRVPWRVGSRIEHRFWLYQSALAEPLEPGEYRVTAGLYDEVLGRYALVTALRKFARGEYQLGFLTVPPLHEATPALGFSEGWLAPEMGQDQQVLVWRVLGGAEKGSVQLNPLPGAGRLLVALEVPRPVSGAHLELLGDAELPVVRVSADCSEAKAEVSGFGFHELVLELSAAFEGGSCRIDVLPNFRIVPRERKPPSSVRLGIVSWIPDHARP